MSLKLGRGGGQVLSMLAFYSNNPNLNPAEVYNFSLQLDLNRTKIDKRGRSWPIWNVFKVSHADFVRIMMLKAYIT